MANFNSDVRCQWLSGKQVQLTRPATGEQFILTIEDFFSCANSQAVSTLHLRGLAHLKCSQPKWLALSSRAIPVRSLYENQ